MRAATLFARRQSRKRNSELIQNVWLESSYPFMLALIFPLYICFEEGSKSLSILLPSSRVDIECWIIKQSAQIHPWLHDSCCHLLLCHNTCRSKRSLVTASPPEPHDNTITWQIFGIETVLSLTLKSMESSVRGKSLRSKHYFQVNVSRNFMPWH